MAGNNILIDVTINGQTIAVQVPPIIGIEITPNPIPYVQQNSDWDSVSGVTEILNKPILGTASALDVPVTGNASATEVVLGNDTRLHPAGGAVTSVTASSPLLSSGGLDPNISIPAATSLVDGYATSTQIAKLDGIQSGATQYTDELAQDAVGGILTNTGNVQFTYDDVTPKITASVDLSGKQDVLGFIPVPDTRTVNGHALNTDVTVTKTDVGLSNVDNTSDTNKPISSATQTALDGKVDENLPITGATNTKITFDSKGLVTAGSNATTSDIADSLNKRYVTDANLTTIGNQSGTNTGDNSVNSLYSGLATSKQDTLVSGTNIKTINSNSLLGSGDIPVLTSLSGAVLTDQTTPQTVSNGQVTFSDGIKLGTIPTIGAFEVGKIYYDLSNKGISAMIDDDITLQLGQESLVLCYNNSGVDIENGKMVYPTGANGDMPTISLALANSVSTSMVIGMTTQSIPNGQSGFVTARGTVHDVDTSSFVSGETLYLSPTIAGGITNIAPTDVEYFSVKIGVVLLINSVNGSIYIREVLNNRLTDLSDVAIDSPLVDQVLKYNGVQWINGAQTSTNAGAGVSFFVSDIEIIPSGTQDAKGLDSLFKIPMDTLEIIESVVVNNSTALIDRYLYDSSLSGTQIESGIWKFNTYARVSSVSGVSSIPTTVYRVMVGVGTLSITGTGTSRTATITGGTPFISTDADSDITISGHIQTPTAILRITGYTSTSVVTVETVSTYSNESSVSYSLHRRLFSDSMTEVNLVDVGLVSTSSVQPAFPIDPTDKLSVAYFGRTTAGTNRTIYLYHGGSSNYTNFETPLLVRHNDLASLQGGSGTERYHLDLAKYNVVQNTTGTNTGDVTLGTASGLSLLSQQLSLGLASSGVTGALSGTDWNTFNNKVSLTGDETVAGIKTFSSFSVTPSALPTLDYQVSNKIYTDTKVPYTVLTDTKDPTGWADPTAVEAAMTYDSATQTISITGTHYFYWRGVKSSVTNFVSTPHANVVGSTYFLFSVDGINFTWDTLPWSFDTIMLASVNYQTAYKYAISECHGLMPWEAHEEFHRTIGTYKESGGTLDATTYTLASTTAAQRRPNVFQTIIHDEDIEHILVTLTSKLYNKFTLSGTGTANFSGETADIIPLLGNNPYYNSFTTPNWTQTLVPNNAYTCVWLVGQPVTQDVNSQGFRYFWVQGQSQGSLATMQGLTPGDVSFGTLSSQVEELVFLVKIIVRYTGGNWVLTSVTNLNGNRFIQTGTTAGTYLSTVTTNGSLTGDGSTGNPLSASSGATTVTAGATTTLTVSSATIQEFTGTTTQIVVLPVVTTLRLGHQFTIANHSTGSITLNSSGGNLVGTITAGNTLVVRCILLTGTTAASWDSDYLVQPTEYVGNGTGNFVRTTSPALVTPSLGVATATSINGNTIVAGTGTISLSTFTLTVPVSMTTAGRNVTNTFTEIQTIQKAVASGTGGMLIFDRIASTNQSFITMVTGATGEFFMGVPANLSNMVVFGSGNGGSVSASLAITKTTGFHFADYSTAIVAPTAWVQVTPPAGNTRAFDVVWGGKTFVTGAELDSSARRDAQAKYTQIGSVHYTNTEEPLGMFIASAQSTTNNLVIGGGNGSFNAMTNLYFYTAANNTTVTGTQQMHIKFGEVIIGTATTGAGRFSILGTTDVIQSVTRAHSTQTASIAEWQSSTPAVLVKISGTGVFFPRQATTAAAPAYVLGGMYYDTTLSKLRIGGATAWETVTSS